MPCDGCADRDARGRLRREGGNENDEHVEERFQRREGDPQQQRLDDDEVDDGEDLEEVRPARRRAADFRVLSHALVQETPVGSTAPRR